MWFPSRRQIVERKQKFNYADVLFKEVLAQVWS